jgi:hypothetical protein
MMNSAPRITHLSRSRRRHSDSSVRLAPALAVYGAALAVLALLVAFAAVHDVTARELARDPLSVAGERPYIGALSQFGILAWAAGAAACLVAWLVLRHHPDAVTRRFFAWGGVLTAVLALDDLFQVHENAAQLPGLSEPLLLAAYPAALVIFLAAFRHSEALHRVAPLMAASLVLLAASMALDRIPEEILVGHPFWEDGAKFLGTAGWAATFIVAAVSYLRPAQGTRAPSVANRYGRAA